MTAEEAVLEAIKSLRRRGTPPNLRTVPEAAAQLLLADSAGRLDFDEAWKQMNEAVASLISDNKIEAWLSDPSREWKIK